MDKLVIDGGKKLNGAIKISGAKNAVLPIMTATIIVPGKYKINNVPNLRDTNTMIDLLKIIGADVNFSGNTLEIDTINCNNPSAPYELVKTMRASFYVLGPLISRFNFSEVSLPGGCAWGPRPVDFHIKAFREMGVDVQLSKGNIIAKGKPVGAEITFPKKSVGATGNVLMAAAKADGITTIHNASMEPEIVSLGDFLCKIGAKVNGIGSDSLEVHPINNENNCIDFDIIPDRIEAGTFLIACAATGGCLTLQDIYIPDIQVVLDLLIKVGCKISYKDNNVTIESDGKIEPCDIETLEFTGFPTDLQAQWMALMSVSKGISTIKENIYKDRFTHISELMRMGADITLKENIATIHGRERLYPAPVMCTDIRASAALVISALCAKGKTEISRIYHIDRGYENIELKLKKVGADISRIVT